MKKDDIYRKLRQDIVSGRLKQGDCLPTENECAENFGVARGTMREALKKLEAEGFLERVKSKGTFIRLPEVKPESRTLSFLVPCEEYLRCFGLHRQRVLFELIAEAAMVGWRVSPVIFSRTNDNHDIWWENLSHFNSDSRIIVDRHWYEPYFETLGAIGARVAYIRNETDILNQHIRECTAKWPNFVELDKAGARAAFEHLQAQGCRKIALAMRYVHQPDHAMCQEYRAFLQRTGQREILIELPKNTITSPIADAYRRFGFDGLLVHCDERALPRQCSVRGAFGLPEGFPIVAIPMFLEELYFDPQERIPTLEYPIRRMAHDIVACLTASQYFSGTHSYEPFLNLTGAKINV